MSKIIERHGTKAVFNGNVHVEIPDTVSALSMVGNGQNLYDGDDFVSEPHWIVNKNLGKKRKQLRCLGGTEGPHIWTKLLAPESLAEIERRYQDIVAKTQSFYETEWKFAMAELKRVKKAHVVPIRHLGKPGTYDEGEKVWEYNVSHFVEVGWSYGFDWIDTPKKMLNVKVGKLVYEAERKSKIIDARRWKFWEAMNETFRAYIYANCKMYNSPSAYHNMFCLIKVNGREYAFECSRRRGITMIDVDRLPEVGAQS